MSDIDIGNWISNRCADEWAVDNGYIHKDDILEKLNDLERDIISLSQNIQLLKEWIKE
jgi:hypothetical protein